MNLDHGNKFDLWYYGQVNFATAKIELSFEMGKKTPLVGWVEFIYIHIYICIYGQ